MASDEIRREARAGRLKPTDGISKSPDGPWTRADAVPGLKFSQAGEKRQALAPSKAGPVPGSHSDRRTLDASNHGPSEPANQPMATPKAHAAVSPLPAPILGRVPTIDLERRYLGIERKISGSATRLRTRSGRNLVKQLEQLAEAGSGSAAFLRGALVDCGLIDAQADARQEALGWFDRAGRMGSIPADAVIVGHAAAGAHPDSRSWGTLGFIGLGPAVADDTVVLRFPISPLPPESFDSSEQVVPLVGSISIAIVPATAEEVESLDPSHPEASTNRLIARCIRAWFEGNRTIRPDVSSGAESCERAFLEVVEAMTSAQRRRVLEVVAVGIEQAAHDAEGPGEEHDSGKRLDLNEVLSAAIADVLDCARADAGVPEASLLRMLDRRQLSAEFLEHNYLLHAIVFGEHPGDAVISGLATFGILPILAPADLHRAIRTDAASQREKGRSQRIRAEIEGRYGGGVVLLSFASASGEERRFPAKVCLQTEAGDDSAEETFDRGLRRRLESLHFKSTDLADPSSAGHWPIPEFLTPKNETHQSARACGQPYPGAFMSMIPSLWKAMDAHRDDPPVRRAFWAAVASNFAVHPSVLGDGLGEVRFHVVDKEYADVRGAMQVLQRVDQHRMFAKMAQSNGKFGVRLGMSYTTRHSSPPPADSWLGSGRDFAVERSDAVAGTVHPEDLEEVLSCAQSWMERNWPSIPWSRPPKALLRKMTVAGASSAVAAGRARHLAELRELAGRPPLGPEPQGAFRTRQGRRGLRSRGDGWMSRVPLPDLADFTLTAAGLFNPANATKLAAGSVLLGLRPDKLVRTLPQLIGRLADHAERLREQVRRRSGKS